MLMIFFVPVIILVLVISMVIFVGVMMMGGSVAEVGRDCEESLVEVLSPGQLDSLTHEAFFAQKLGSSEVGIDERPGVKVLVVLEPNPGKHAPAPEFKASWEILELQECFLEFPVDLVIRVGKNINIGEAGEPIIDPEVQSRLKTLNSEIVIGIVGMAPDLAERVSRGVADDAIEMKGGIKTDVCKQGARQKSQDRKGFHNCK